MRTKLKGMSYSIGSTQPQCPWTPGKAMSFHHIIPRSVLIRVFNRLLETHTHSAEAEARTCLYQFLALCRRNHPELERLADRLRTGATGPRRAGHNPLAPLAVHELTAVHSTVIWPAWDVVEGPSNRSDDPRDRYLDRFTVGLKPDEVLQMRAIEALYPSLQAAISSGPSVVLSGALRAARMTLHRESPIRYRPDMWDWDPAKPSVAGRKLR